MRNIFKLFALATILLFVSCTETKQKTPEVNITSSISPSDGLDLKLVGSLFQNGKVSDAASLEKELNREGGINNLDLDGNKQTDYINVSENTGTSSVKSLDLTTGNDVNKTHIATVEIEKGVDGQYNVHMSGSEQLYAQGSTYSSSFSPSVSEMIFYSWLFNPRPLYYHSPYHYGYYPSYYSQRGVVSRSAYSSRTVTQRTVASKTTTKNATYKPKTTSTNKNKVSPAARKSISNAKTANKSFKKQNSSSAKKGGFTKSKSTTTKPKSSPKRTKTRSRSTRSRSSSRRSDDTYKTNVIAIVNPLEIITKLNGVTYNWNTEVLDTNEKFLTVVGTDTDTSTQVGFIAQEVKEVAPTLVTSDEYGLKVNYDLTTAFLVEAVKEQQKQIQALQRELLELKDAQLKQYVKELKEAQIHLNL
jgi:hypothetical protein